MPLPQLHPRTLITPDTNKRVVSELRGLLPCQEIIISLVAAVVRKFMQGCHAGRYLWSKRPTIFG